MTGFVYAIGDGEDRVKIGWSADPIHRMAKLQTDCPTRATLLGLVPATKAQEAELHELLDPWRLNGEWFRLEGIVAAFVGILPTPQPRLSRIGAGRPPRVVYDDAHPLLKHIVANTQQRQFAREVGCSEPHLSIILSGKKRPSLQLAARMSRATGGAVPIEAFVEAARGAR